MRKIGIVSLLIFAIITKCYAYMEVQNNYLFWIFVWRYSETPKTSQQRIVLKSGEYEDKCPIVSVVQDLRNGEYIINTTESEWKIWGIRESRYYGDYYLGYHTELVTEKYKQIYPKNLVD